VEAIQWKLFWVTLNRHTHVTLTPVFWPRTARRRKQRVPRAPPSAPASNEMYLRQIRHSRFLGDGVMMGGPTCTVLLARTMRECQIPSTVRVIFARRKTDQLVQARRCESERRQALLPCTLAAPLLCACCACALPFEPSCVRAIELHATASTMPCQQCWLPARPLPTRCTFTTTTHEIH
jgi:hypothetical protein